MIFLRLKAALLLVLHTTELSAAGTPREDSTERPPTQAQVEKLHGLVDADKDGKLSIDELFLFASDFDEQYAAKQAQESFGDIDRDKNGRVDMHEIRDYDTEADSSEERFKAADADGDGMLDSKELIGFMFPWHNDKVATLLAESSFRDMDRDKNGRLSEEEIFVTERPLPLDDQGLKLLDEDNDGNLNFSEYKQWFFGVYDRKADLLEVAYLADQDSDGLVTMDELMSTWQDTHADSAFRWYQFSRWAAQHEL
eukprot:TRINITY_DN45407_c0_g1_i1.p1 TRINITY_DN45407_c0_g1~~TRINITY_DN45407_c0_g1_i1.p1  ORF type:complete len:254 (+),score=75.14 TRINITY_DN45407_c0_g1_i1:65-826(+)